MLNKISLLVLTMTAIAAQAADAPVLINGAGATFPYPIYGKWFSEYRKADPSVTINYQSIGSGGGIKQFSDKTVDFGATDAPMSDDELKKAGAPVVHVPTVLGSVVLSYNVPGVTQSIKLTSDIIADIYLGKITQWTDARITAVNPGVKFPDKTYIMPVYRSDGSGTTSVFTDYLGKISAEWKSKVGVGKSVKFPAGLGGKGNEGVSGLIKQTPGSIGYVELIYAESNKLPVAHVKNKAGNFIAPSVKATTAAAAGALKSMPEDFRVSITDADGKDAYPISAFTYLIVYQTLSGAKGEHLKKFLNWALADGQKMASSLSYAPLPDSLVKKVKTKVQALQVQK